MTDCMIDIEGLATSPESTILTIAAQLFDPFKTGFPEDKFYYTRVDLESQKDREIDDATVEWWSKQSPKAQQDAFSDEGRIPLTQALEDLTKIVWNCNRIWCNGPTYDIKILDHAYKTNGMRLPWQYYKVRDVRTVTSLCPSLDKPPASHHPLEDCRRQIELLQDALDYLKVREMI